VINQLGNGLSTSPHNSPPPYDMARFSHVRIGDDVRAQEQLLREQFGIEQLALVTGGSMGAQQTYEWAVRFPDKVKRAAPIAGTARNTPHDFLYTQTLMDTITCDPGFAGRWYRQGTDVQFMEAYFGVMDPNDLLTMAWKWQRGDVSRHTGGDLAAALGRITAKTLVLPISHDMFFSPEDCAAEQALIPAPSCA